MGGQYAPSGNTFYLPQVMRTLGWEPSELELNELINVIDQDGNGVITFNEFVWFSTK